MEFRQGDGPQERRAAAAARRGVRSARTVFLSIVASGIVALFIGYVNDKDQRNRSVVNCQLMQQDRLDAIKALERSADNSLGNPKKGIPPLKYKGTSLEEFRPLIIANAKRSRERANEIRKRLENCDEVFPDPEIVPFIG